METILEKEKEKEKNKDKNKDIWWRALTFFLSIFIIGPAIPVSLFLLYMLEYTFFSYDFFIEGVFAMKWFILSAYFFVFALSFGLYAPIFVACLRKKLEKHVKTKEFWLSWIFPLFLWPFIICACIKLELTSFLIFMLIVCSSIAFHTSILIGCSAKYGFFSLIFIVFILVYSCFIFRSNVVLLVSVGLRGFGVGGDVLISFIEPETKESVIGELKLLTPKNAYIGNLRPLISDDESDMSVSSELEKKAENKEVMSTYSLDSIKGYHIEVK